MPGIRIVQRLGRKEQSRIYFEVLIDFDNFGEVKQCLLEVLKKIQFCGQRSTGAMRIAANLNSGTSPQWLLALTLFALTKGRQIEYFEQGAEGK